MSEDKIYRVRTKEGAHVNEKINEDGYRAAIQFDENNDLQGPLEIIEVDKEEFVTEREVIVEVEKEERSFGQVILEDAVVPAVAEVVTELLTKAAYAGIDAFGNWMSNKVIPAAKAKGGELIDKAIESRAEKKAKKMEQKKNAVDINKQTSISNATVQTETDTVMHTAEEVEQIVNNMKYAALYIAAGIRELSKTVVSNDEIDPVVALEMQNRLKELSTGEVMRTIDFMLEEKNRDVLDQATIQLFEAFRHKDFIVDGEAVPISKYLEAVSQEQIE